MYTVTAPCQYPEMIGSYGPEGISHRKIRIPLHYSAQGLHQDPSRPLLDSTQYTLYYSDH